MPITEKDRRWIKAAKKLIPTSQHPKYLMISLLIKGGRLVSIGRNSKGPAPFFLKHAERLGRHAEVMCLFGISKDFSKGGTIYVVGTTVQNNPILSRPCPSCLDFLQRSGIKRIIYLTKEQEIKEEKIN